MFKLIDIRNFNKEGQEFFVLVLYGYNDIHNVYIDNKTYLTIKGDKTFDINKHIDYYYKKDIKAFKLKYKA